MVFSESACDAFKAPLTQLAAELFGASAGLAHGDASVFHWRVCGRAIEAGADHVAALGLRAHALPTLCVGSVVDQDRTIGALDGITVERI